MTRKACRHCLQPPMPGSRIHTIRTASTPPCPTCRAPIRGCWQAAPIMLPRSMASPPAAAAGRSRSRAAARSSPASATSGTSPRIPLMCERASPGGFSQHCLAEAWDAGISTMMCQSTLPAEPFYRSAGFRRIADDRGRDGHAGPARHRDAARPEGALRRAASCRAGSAGRRSVRASFPASRPRPWPWRRCGRRGSGLRGSRPRPP